MSMNIRSILNKGLPYTKKCIVHAVAMMNVLDIKSIILANDVFCFFKSDTISKIDKLSRDMEIALDSACNVSDHIYLTDLRGSAGTRESETTFMNLQRVFSEVKTRLKEQDVSLRAKYGDNFIREKMSGKIPEDVLAYQNALSAQETIETIAKSITEEDVANNKQIESEGISFIDRYDALLQSLINLSEKARKDLLTINFILDVIAIILLFWDEYCEQKEKVLESVLKSKECEIEKAISDLIQEKG